MDDFFTKHRRIIQYLMYATAFLVSIIILFLFIETSVIWKKISDELIGSLIPFFIAFLLAYLIHPLILWIDRLRLPRAMSIILFYSVVVGSLYAVISWFLPTLIHEIHDLILNLPTYLNSLEQQLILFDERTGLTLSQTFMSEYSEWMSTLSSHFQEVTILTFNLIFSIVGSLMSVIIIPIALFYFLKDYEKILNALLKLVPKKYQSHVMSITRLLDESLGAYIRGLALIMICLSLITTFLLFLVGIDYSLLFGILIGLTDIIPFVGPFIGAIPVVIFAFSISWNKALIVIGIIIVVQMIESNFLQPLIIGRNLDIHPLLIMILMMVAGGLLGLKGVFFAIPTFLVIRTLLGYFRELRK